MSNSTVKKGFCLITAGNLNLDTVRFVAGQVKEIAEGRIEQVFLVADNTTGQSNPPIYTEIFGGNTLITIANTHNNGSIDDTLIVQISRIAKDSKLIIDISNGQKITTSPLYLMGCFLGAEAVYMSRNLGGGVFVYEKVNTFREISDLSRLANIDLLRYTSDLESLNENIEEYSMFHGFVTQIHRSIKLFFDGEYPESVQSSTKIYEKILREIRKNNLFEDLIREYEVKMEDIKPDLGDLKYLSLISQRLSESNEKRRKIKKESPKSEEIVLVEKLMASIGIMRIFRNISSHEFGEAVMSEDDARFAIQTCIHSLRTIARSYTINGHFLS